MGHHVSCTSRTPVLPCRRRLMLAHGVCSPAASRPTSSVNPRSQSQSCHDQAEQQWIAKLRFFIFFTNIMKWTKTRIYTTLRLHRLGVTVQEGISRKSKTRLAINGRLQSSFMDDIGSSIEKSEGRSCCISRQKEKSFFTVFSGRAGRPDRLNTGARISPISFPFQTRALLQGLLNSLPFQRTVH